jgi:acetyl/propionyl-CoA carboxylase alpha subunit
MPAGDGIRIDSGVRAGDRVPPDYDPLLAKLLVVAPTRAAAIAKLRDALDDVQVTGIMTTLPFHRFVAREPTFAAGELSTDWVAECWDGAADRARAIGAAYAAAATAALAAAPEVTEAVMSHWRRAAREDSRDRWPE